MCYVPVYVCQQVARPLGFLVLHQIVSEVTINVHCLHSYHDKSSVVITHHYPYIHCYASELLHKIKLFNKFLIEATHW